MRMGDGKFFFVDDGSSDGSTDFLLDLAKKTDGVLLVQFFHNCGKAAAIAEGFKLANGEYIITMDSDLQDDPAEIPKLVEKLEEGYDLISGWKADRKDPWAKTFPSRIFNTVTRALTSINIHDFNCGLKIYRKEVVKMLDIYGGRHRYIPALAGQKKFRISEVKVNHRPRLFGKSKYTNTRILHGFFDLIAILFFNRYIQQPLHLFGSIGMAVGISGVIIDLYVVYLKYYHADPFQLHMPLLLFGILLIIVGGQIFSVGLLGEMLTLYHHRHENRIKQIVSKKRSV